MRLGIAGGVALILLLVALVLVQPPALSRPAALGLGGLALLTGWAAVSMTWAESVDQAWNEVNRFGFYTITLALVIGAVRTRRHAATVMGVLTAGMAIAGFGSAAKAQSSSYWQQPARAATSQPGWQQPRAGAPMPQAQVQQPSVAGLWEKPA